MEKVICYEPSSFNFTSQSFSHLKNLNDLEFEYDFKNTLIEIPPDYKLGLQKMNSVSLYFYGSKFNLMELLRVTANYQNVKSWEIYGEEL